MRILFFETSHFLHVAFSLSLWDSGRIAVFMLAKCDQVALKDCDHVRHFYCLALRRVLFLCLHSREGMHKDLKNKKQTRKRNIASCSDQRKEPIIPHAAHNKFVHRNQGKCHISKHEKVHVHGVRLGTARHFWKHLQAQLILPLGVHFHEQLSSLR